MFSDTQSANKCAVALRDVNFTLKTRAGLAQLALAIRDRPQHFQSGGGGIHPYYQVFKRMK